MTTSDRDTLTAYLTSFVEREAWADTAEEAAEYIESALRWRPPAQVITTAAELDALPRWSIVVIDNVAVQRTDNDWRAMNAPSLRIASTALLQLRGALTLVYVPTEEVESRG
jgi:hypothetical protein